MNAMECIRKIFNILVFVSLSFFSGQVQSQQKYYDYTKFLPHSYTSDFSLGVDVILNGKLKLNSETFKIKLSTQDDPGFLSVFEGREWIEVRQSGIAKIGKKTSNFRMVQLFDPKTKLLNYEINRDEREIKFYQWAELPESLRSGESKKVGRSEERDFEGNIISNGEVSIRLVANKRGFEFCSFEKSRKVKDLQVESIESCDQFNKQYKIIGVKIKINDGESIFLLSGTVNLR